MKLKLIVFLLFFVFLFACVNPSSKYKNLDEFAKCLNEKGVVMYGAFWCPHCQRIKVSFGDSFKHLNYVECDPRGDNAKPELCQEKGIDKYATFIFPDNSRLIGEPSLEELAEKSGCSLIKA